MPYISDPETDRAIGTKGKLDRRALVVASGFAAFHLLHFLFPGPIVSMICINGAYLIGVISGLMAWRLGSAGKTKLQGQRFTFRLSFKERLACYFRSTVNLILFSWIVTVHPEQFQDSGE